MSNKGIERTASGRLRKRGHGLPLMPNTLDARKPRPPEPVVGRLEQPKGNVLTQGDWGVAMTRNDHVAFEVSDMDAALEFYTQALGMQLLFRSANVEVGEDYAFLELEGGNLELIQRLSGPPFEKPEIKAPYCPHLALTTMDMAATVQMIGDKHVPLVKGRSLLRVRKRGSTSTTRTTTSSSTSSGSHKTTGSRAANLGSASNKGIEQNARSYTGEERRLRVCSYLTRWTHERGWARC